ncbi:MAG: glycosyltransferase family 2 protein [Bacilli bacterium]|nr:glycosyltransferase family 2 protein [Bacilli bacterium]
MNCSIVINTLNEVNNIEYLLKSIKKIKTCNEILVADMGSTDGTLNILKKYKVKILNIQYDENFDNGRKILLEKAKNEWCFLIDADEIVTSSLAKKIDQIVMDNVYDIVYLPFLNYFFGTKTKYGVHFPCLHCRLFKKSFINVTGVMHSFLEIVNAPNTLMLSDEKYAIIHFSYNNIDEWLNKRLRYIKFECKHNNKFHSPFFLFIVSFIRFYFKDGAYKGGYDGFILALTQCTSEAIANFNNYYDNKKIDVKSIKEEYLKS